MIKFVYYNYELFILHIFFIFIHLKARSLLSLILLTFFFQTNRFLLRLQVPGTERCGHGGP